MICCLLKEFFRTEKQEYLFEVMKKAYERNSLMACAINVNFNFLIEQILDKVIYQ